MNSQGDVQWNANGWTMTGSGYVGGRTSYNLLGGYVSFTIVTSGSSPGVNSNLVGVYFGSTFTTASV
jgi:hypothetical protein